MIEVMLFFDVFYGNWGFVNEIKVFIFIVFGKNLILIKNNNVELCFVDLDVYFCYYEDCIILVLFFFLCGRLMEFFCWFNVDDWDGIEFMYGGYGRRLFGNGSDVKIMIDWYMLVDI